MLDSYQLRRKARPWLLCNHEHACTHLRAFITEAPDLLTFAFLYFLCQIPEKLKRQRTVHERKVCKPHLPFCVQNKASGHQVVQGQSPPPHTHTSLSLGGNVLVLNSKFLFCSQEHNVMMSSDQNGSSSLKRTCLGSDWNSSSLTQLF